MNISNRFEALSQFLAQVSLVRTLASLELLLVNESMEDYGLFWVAQIQDRRALAILVCINRDSGK